MDKPLAMFLAAYEHCIGRKQLNDPQARFADSGCPHDL